MEDAVNLSSSAYAMPWKMLLVYTVTPSSYAIRRYCIDLSLSSLITEKIPDPVQLKFLYHHERCCRPVQLQFYTTAKMLWLIQLQSYTAAEDASSSSSATPQVKDAVSLSASFTCCRHERCCPACSAPDHDAPLEGNVGCPAPVPALTMKMLLMTRLQFTRRH
ncbi:hypothetical protein AVEN_76207-1 [Araneus ventricosus]|uniref:Uncharacterized protein n=1 Tax=Araneus ventricosus TaxID=182803 RepID=A0A4Y2NK21_ARAVE|nr:hypothetical protein AVEN_76207-1 [Araneus ventricosus]